MNFDQKLHFICNNVNELSHEDKVQIARMIWSNKKIRSKIIEKGDGTQINCKYLSKALVDKLYEWIKKKLNSDNLFSDSI